VADGKINEAWDARLEQPAPVQLRQHRQGTMRGLESLLARYFAPGRQPA
jgi:hypothetical protein